MFPYRGQLHDVTLALPDLGMMVAHLFFRRCHGGGGGRWMMFQRDTYFFRDEIIILFFMGFFVQVCLTRMFMSYDDHMCNQQII
jgi:hypothetical protein